MQGNYAFQWYRVVCLFCVCSVLILGIGANNVSPVYAQSGEDPTPPVQPVKLIFIHHSCGENWLSDGNGDLGRVLGESNYYVSDTNYGWGPDGIGDTTDILDWPRWFLSPQSDRYLDALYNESGQYSSYTRTLSDPGGENKVIMFKSCFPNSDLGGSPNDPPTPGDNLTVGTAKFIYNELLDYFQTRPDKLFVIITAPPLQNPGQPANARAFNTWLVQDWLEENDYPYNNVAVWDFYNVLTGPDNHHRFQNGQVEYITNRHGDTHGYADNGDDHPSSTGNRKATAEFVPMLNVFYHRWHAENPPEFPSQSPNEDVSAREGVPPDQVPESPPVEVSAPTSSLGMIDSFEKGVPSGTAGWEYFWDETTATTITCARDGNRAYGGSSSMKIDYSVTAASWATCVLFYDSVRDLRSETGLAFFVSTEEQPATFDLIVYTGEGEERQTFMQLVEYAPQSGESWVYIEVPWQDLLRADWEENAGAPLTPDRVQGFAFGFDGLEDAANTGTVWIDSLHFIGGVAFGLGTENDPQTQPDPSADSADQKNAGEETPGPLRTCPLPFFTAGTALLAGVFLQRKRY